MPRIVRNFWIDLQVDGRNTKIGTGPRRKDGGFSLDVKQNDDGGIVDAVSVRGYVNREGVLTLTVTDPETNNDVLVYKTCREHPGKQEASDTAKKNSKVGLKYEKDPSKIAGLRYLAQFMTFVESFTTEELHEFTSKMLAGRL